MAEPRRETDIATGEATTLGDGTDTAAGDDSDAGNWISFDARCADALVELCAAHVAESTSERATVVIHTTATDLTGDGHGTTWDGVIIGNDTLRRLCCDARIRLTTHTDHGAVVGVGRTTRIIPAWLLAELRWRDSRCRFPGCDRTRWLHAHHIQHWADGGPTDLNNLVLLCQHHHRFLHESQWQLTGTPNGPLTYTRPGGRHYTCAPAIRHTTTKHPPTTNHPPDITEPETDPHELSLTTA